MVESSGRHLMLGEAVANINRRILVIDDNAAIHEDFRKVLSPPVDSGNALDLLETELLGESVVTVAPQFELDSAFQGQEGLEKLFFAQGALLSESDPNKLLQGRAGALHEQHQPASDGLRGLRAVVVLDQ